jgi:AhpC/TSA family
MARTVMGSLAVLVLLPALWAEAAREYKALSDEYNKALNESDKLFERAKTAQERQKIRADFQKQRSEIVGRFLAFAEKHPKDREALLALFFVLHPDIQAEGRQVDQAVQLVLKDHIKIDRLTNPPIVQMLGSENSPVGESLLREVLEKNPHRAVQAQACLSLGQILKARAEAGPAEQAAKLSGQAEGYFERVVEKYADVKDAAEPAKAELFEMRHLAVGKSAPDIAGKDSDEKEFKLSDYRGKVVVLDFWAEW